MFIFGFLKCSGTVLLFLVTGLLTLTNAALWLSEGELGLEISSDVEIISGLMR